MCSCCFLSLFGCLFVNLSDVHLPVISIYRRAVCRAAPFGARARAGAFEAAFRSAPLRAIPTILHLRRIRAWTARTGPHIAARTTATRPRGRSKGRPAILRSEPSAPHFSGGGVRTEWPAAVRTHVRRVPGRTAALRSKALPAWSKSLLRSAKLTRRTRHLARTGRIRSLHPRCVAASRLDGFGPTVFAVQPRIRARFGPTHLIAVLVSLGLRQSVER